MAALVFYIVCSRCQSIAHSVKSFLCGMLAADTCCAGIAAVLECLMASVIGAVKLVALTIGCNLITVLACPACLAGAGVRVTVYGAVTVIANAWCAHS